MATGRKREKPPKKPRSRKKPVPRLSQAEADDLALAEEILRPPSPEEQAMIEAELKKFRKALRKLGIHLPARPIDAKKLRERMIQRGIDPEGNEFSRGIIEMREE
jgi:hypothetical protein